MGMRVESIALVTRDTRLEGLMKRKATRGAAKFSLGTHRARERAYVEAHETLDEGARFAFAVAEKAAAIEEYESEDAAQQDAEQRLRRELDLGYPVVPVDRSFVPNFDFSRCIAVVVAGPDGLVANVAKYVGDLPIVGVNPDPKRNDGVLLPFTIDQARNAVRRTVERRARVRTVTLAQVTLSDGQTMTAFNDFFVGAASHVSARYTLRVGRHAEAQSSSGLIVSTGAGSTGWLSSVWNMATGVARSIGGEVHAPPKRRWEDRELVWVVREPFVSRHSSADLVAGVLRDGEQIVVESLMPERGVIFSDGVEADFLEFASGTTARIAASDQSAHLVVG